MTQAPLVNHNSASFGRNSARRNGSSLGCGRRKSEGCGGLLGSLVLSERALQSGPGCTFLISLSCWLHLSHTHTMVSHVYNRVFRSKL